MLAAEAAGVTGQSHPAPGGQPSGILSLHCTACCSQEAPGLEESCVLGGRDSGRTGKANSLVTARYVEVCTSPAALRAKHWNMPVSSGTSPLICRPPSPRCRKRLSLPTSTTAESLYQVMEGGGTPVGGERPPSAASEGCPGS